MLAGFTTPGTVWGDEISVTPVTDPAREYVVDPKMEAWYERPTAEQMGDADARFARLETDVKKLEASAPEALAGDYVDIYYTDGTPLYGRTIDWQTGTTGWQYGEMTIEPAKPIRNVNVCLLLRGHAGTTWFDDLFVAEDPLQ
jgi:hypothetical protein